MRQDILSIPQGLVIEWFEGIGSIGGTPLDIAIW